MLLNLKFLILDKMSYLVVQIHIYWSRRINPKKMSIHLYQICHWQVSSIGTHNRYAHFDHRYQCGWTEYVLFRHYSTLEVLKYQMKPRIYYDVLCYCPWWILLTRFSLCMWYYQPPLWLPCQDMCSDHMNTISFITLADQLPHLTYIYIYTLSFLSLWQAIYTDKESF